MNRTEYLKQWRETNKEKLTKQKFDYYTAHTETLKAAQKEWREANKEKIRANQKLKMSTNNLFKLKVNVKNLIGNSIRNSGFKKLSRTEEILGCSYKEFKLYVESKFEYWMTWENRGLYNGELNYGWDIDHIVPLSSAICEADIIRLNHYTNLQPLCSKVNRNIKRNN